MHFRKNPFDIINDRLALIFLRTINNNNDLFLSYNKMRYEWGSKGYMNQYNITSTFDSLLMNIIMNKSRIGKRYKCCTKLSKHIKII